jgi:predicted AAA+ superfamily ATPase
MIRANIEAAIEEKTKEIDLNRSEILKLDKIIETVKAQQKRLLEKDTDLCYELEELKEQL